MIEATEEADAGDSEEDEPPEELYTTLHTSIVGVQYYKGYTHRIFFASRTDASGRSRWVWRTGETPTGTAKSIRPVSSLCGGCMRLSDQQFRNAVRVLNINNIQVGHVPRNVVAKLAPLLDQGKVTVEGTMLEGNSKFPMSQLSHGSDPLQWALSSILSRCESPTPPLPSFSGWDLQGHQNLW